MDPACEKITFEEALKRLPSLRRLRRVSADFIRTVLVRQKGECTWCGAEVPKGRRTWCSQKCTNSFLERCDPHFQAKAILQRDGYICQLCGRDTQQSSKQYTTELRLLQADRTAGRITPEQYRPLVEALKFKHGGSRDHFGEIDHVVPVVEGGGLCGLEGLRWVCGTCHLQVTNELAARRAKRPKKRRVRR